MVNNITLQSGQQIDNCIDCPNHEVINDPDPYDWFCDDDQAVLCKISPNTPVRGSKWISERAEFRTITAACRPYNIRKECNIPDWCPLKSDEVEKETDVEDTNGPKIMVIGSANSGKYTIATIIAAAMEQLDFEVELLDDRSSAVELLIDQPQPGSEFIPFTEQLKSIRSKHPKIQVQTKPIIRKSKK